MELQIQSFWVTETCEFEEILVHAFDSFHWLKIIRCISNSHGHISVIRKILVNHIHICPLCYVSLIQFTSMKCLYFLSVVHIKFDIFHVCLYPFDSWNFCLNQDIVFHNTAYCIFTRVTLFMLHYILTLLQESLSMWARAGFSLKSFMQVKNPQSD